MRHSLFGLFVVAVAYAGEIRGVVMGPRAEVRIQGSVVARTDAEGRFQSGGLAAGTYDLEIHATGFYLVWIQGVELKGDEVKIVPAVTLDWIPFYACQGDRRPSYYRLAASHDDEGSVGGIVTSEAKTPVEGAEVILYFADKGRIDSTRTDDKGRFTFSGLVSRQGYWVSISGVGYFAEELNHLTVQSGLESVYAPIELEACSPGQCEPHLKTIPVLPTCA